MANIAVRTFFEFVGIIDPLTENIRNHISNIINGPITALVNLGFD